jgi:hypothetical protein
MLRPSGSSRMPGRPRCRSLHLRRGPRTPSPRSLGRNLDVNRSRRGSHRMNLDPGRPRRELDRLSGPLRLSVDASPPQFDPNRAIQGKTLTWEPSLDRLGPRVAQHSPRSWWDSLSPRRNLHRPRLDSCRSQCDSARRRPDLPRAERPGPLTPPSTAPGSDGLPGANSRARYLPGHTV